MMIWPGNNPLMRYFPSASESDCPTGVWNELTVLTTTNIPGAGFSPIVTRPVIDAVGLGLLSGVCAFVMSHDCVARAIARKTVKLRRRLKRAIGDSPIRAHRMCQYGEG